MANRAPKQFVPLGFSFLVTAACLFGRAGSFDWRNAWLLLAINFAAGLAALAVLWRSPDLLAERSNIKPGKSWDKPLVFIVVLLGPSATWITSGMGVRFHWSQDFDRGWVAFGAVAAAGAAAWIAWAMHVNRFFSSVVRIQKERRHTVVSYGPYSVVRHPGYLGMALFTLLTPLILNSSFAFIPAVITVAVWVLRTAIEDRTLRHELDGYQDYSTRVKYRLVPFLW
jgi:protein-S-isoprenylcysteine O-methyltransferase Ste14